MDEHDPREFERVATGKVVRCVRNRHQDPSPPPRATRVASSPVVPPSRSSASSPSYQLDENQEKGEVEESKDKQEVNAAQDEEILHAQQQDESVEILGGTHKPVTSEPSTGKDKDPMLETVQKRARLKRTPQSRATEASSEHDGQGERSSKRPKRSIVTVQEAVVDTCQPSPTNE